MIEMFKLAAEDAWALHHLRNFLIVLVSVILLPLSASITLFALILSYSKLVRPPRQLYASRHGGKPPPRILVSGVGMCKGLFLARTMYLGGCDVYGADFSKAYFNLHCGRFSSSLEKFFALKSPATDGEEAYISQVIEIIDSYRMDLWISCSGVATAMEDARLARAIRKRTKCRVFQFDEKVIDTLDDKLKFMEKTDELKLSALQWYPIDSTEDIPSVIGRIERSQHIAGCRDMKFLIKSANMDDMTRGSLPLLSPQNSEENEIILRSLDYSQGRKWIVQEFVEGEEEYCTHAVVVNGAVRAFTACPSASVLMHYQQLDSTSILWEKMLHFTQKYASGLGNSITGHLSFDFLVRYRDTEDGLVGNLAPTECNPRCHTAVVLFEGDEVELADRYLEVLNGVNETAGILKTDVAPETGFYWTAHDALVLLLSSLVDMLRTRDLDSCGRCLQQILDGIYHLIMWRDATFCWWDPLPWLVLNHLYWPSELILASCRGVKWKQVNISTMKMFKM